MACNTMSLTQEQLKAVVEAIYQPLMWKTFSGSIVERDTTKVPIKGTDIVRVDSQDIQLLMQAIGVIVNEVSKMYIPLIPFMPAGERVWKGITICPDSFWLWVKSYKGNDTTNKFIVQNIEVNLIDLEKPTSSYVAIVKITLN